MTHIYNSKVWFMKHVLVKICGYIHYSAYSIWCSLWNICWLKKQFFCFVRWNIANRARLAMDLVWLKRPWWVKVQLEKEKIKDCSTMYFCYITRGIHVFFVSQTFIHTSTFHAYLRCHYSDYSTRSQNYA
jgi:hypothetical protein